MWDPAELAEFALTHFERGLEALTDEEARRRMPKDGGGQMNAISWTVGHIAWQWILLAAEAAQAQNPDVPWEAILGDQRRRTERFRFTSDDPTPPPLADALELLREARAATSWLWEPGVEAVLSTAPQGSTDDVGTSLMQAALHTWFHTGEINAVRQMLGHAEIVFVGPMTGFTWRPEPSAQPAPASAGS